MTVVSVGEPFTNVILSTVRPGSADAPRAWAQTPPETEAEEYFLWEMEAEEEDPWCEFGMDEAGHIEGNGAQDHGDVLEALPNLIDTLLQKDP